MKLYLQYIRNTERSSEWYGPCEICEKHCASVWSALIVQVNPAFQEMRQVFHFLGNVDRRMGHRECIESQHEYLPPDQIALLDPDRLDKRLGVIETMTRGAR